MSGARPSGTGSRASHRANSSVVSTKGFDPARGDFQSKLSAMVSKELCGDAEAVAEVIERLTDSLGLAVAVSCRGNIALADNMITGVEGYLAECIARHARLAAFMAEVRGISAVKARGEHNDR